MTGFPSAEYIIVSGTVDDTAQQLQENLGWARCLLRFRTLLNQPEQLQTYITAMIDGLASNTSNAAVAG